MVSKHCFHIFITILIVFTSSHVLADSAHEIFWCILNLLPIHPPFDVGLC